MMYTLLYMRETLALKSKIKTHTDAGAVCTGTAMRAGAPACLGVPAAGAAGPSCLRPERLIRMTILSPDVKTRCSNTKDNPNPNTIPIFSVRIPEMGGRVE